MRPNWTEYFVVLAHQISSRATCPVRKVGAVFVNPQTHNILTVGYNGSPRGLSHCGDACKKRRQGEGSDQCKAIHAEANAIYNAAFNGTNLNGSVAYLTLNPCLGCARAMIQVGVKEVCFGQYHPSYGDALDLLDEAGVSYYSLEYDMQTTDNWWDETEDVDYFG